MNINDFTSGNSLKAQDLEGKEFQLHITHIEAQDFDQENDKGEKYVKSRPVIHFRETDKTLVCNKTNMLAIAAQYGDDMDAWAGAMVRLYPTTTDYKGTTTPCIRVREMVEEAAPSDPGADPFA